MIKLGVLGALLERPDNAFSLRTMNQTDDRPHTPENFRHHVDGSIDNWAINNIPHDIVSFPANVPS
jgi:hypothetical protein